MGSSGLRSRLCAALGFTLVWVAWHVVLVSGRATGKLGWITLRSEPVFFWICVVTILLGLIGIALLFLYAFIHARKKNGPNLKRSRRRGEGGRRGERPTSRLDEAVGGRRYMQRESSFARPAADAPDGTLRSLRSLRLMPSVGPALVPVAAATERRPPVGRHAAALFLCYLLSAAESG